MIIIGTPKIMYFGDTIETPFNIHNSIHFGKTNKKLKINEGSVGNIQLVNHDSSVQWSCKYYPM